MSNANNPSASMDVSHTPEETRDKINKVQAEIDNLAPKLNEARDKKKEAYKHYMEIDKQFTEDGYQYLKLCTDIIQEQKKIDSEPVQGSHEERNTWTNALVKYAKAFVEFIQYVTHDPFDFSREKNSNRIDGNNPKIRIFAISIFAISL